MSDFLWVPHSARVGLRLSSVFFAASALGGAAAAAAEPPLSTTVVTAARVSQPLTDVLADVSLLDRDAIERSGAVGLADLLGRLPGVEWARNGGPAAATSVYLRGGETRHTLLLVDGVRVESQATGGPSWHGIALDQIDRIEVLRGPAAAIYGSDAVSGVVQIFTRKGEGAVRPHVSVGLGSHGTRKADWGVSGATGSLDYAFSLGQERSTGFNAQPTANPDRDGYRRQSSSARLGWRLDSNHQLEATWLGSNGQAQYDGFSPGQNDRGFQDTGAWGLNWLAQWTPQWRSKAVFTQGQDRYETQPSPYVTDTRVSTLLWQNEWTVGAHTWTAALERRDDRLVNASTTPPNTRRHQTALALSHAWKAQAHTLQANLRQDDDSEFGRYTTGAVAYAHHLSKDWRLTASAGTAFRAPTLFQRFSLYGVPGLRPERSTNLELGARYAAQGQQVSVVAYRNRVRDLINYVSGPGTCANGVGAFAGCYGNTGRAQYAGVTLAGGVQLGGVNLTGSLDWQDPTDRITGKRLARRAERLGKLMADTRWQGWRLSGEWLLSGDRFNNATNTQRLGGYGLVNLAASTDLAPGWQLLARVDNLADKTYQTATGFATAGRTVYVGLKWSGR